MAEKKADLIVRAKELGVEVKAKDTIADIKAAIDTASAVNVEQTIVVDEKAETENASGTMSAKAGKRSAKSLRAAEEEAERQERKELGDTTAVDENGEARSTRGPRPITRPLIERRGKKYRELAGKIEAAKVYALADALELATQTSPSKFDASVEIHVRLGVDPRQADQNIRQTVSLPNGTGKTIRVAVFAPEADHAKATAAGADVVGDETFLAQLEKETLDFDTLIATPAFMPRLGKYARLLGPRGLMPNPKSGTVAADVASAVTAAKAGKVEYRVDKQAIVHLSIGKVSFGATKLAENAKVFFDSLNGAKPTSLKGAYVKSISISTTQGPGIKVENQ
jgi:large subunit ribosomal protein L1